MLHIDAAQVDAALDWPSLVEALRAGHRAAANPQIGDMLLGPPDGAILVRGAVMPDLGTGLKAVTVYPGNRSRDPVLPAVQGLFLLFAKEDGRLLATIDGAAITPWKTAADSALGSLLLSAPDAIVMTMIGAGTMARPLIEAHLSVRPSIREIVLWNRTRANAEALAEAVAPFGRKVRVADTVESAIRAGDVISCATFSIEPLVRGVWLKPGAHLDLVGAFRADMREADDEALSRGRLFVDARATTLDHIGELLIPLQTGVIGRGKVEGDFFDLCGGFAVNRQPADITVFKNGGGAHLDLMTAWHIYRRVTDG